MYHNGHNNQFGSSTTTIISFINLSMSFLLRVGCVVIILDPTRKLGRRQKKWAIFWKKKKSNKETFIRSKTDSLSFLALNSPKVLSTIPTIQKGLKRAQVF